MPGEVVGASRQHTERLEPWHVLLDLAGLLVMRSCRGRGTCVKALQAAQARGQTYLPNVVHAIIERVGACIHCPDLPSTK